MSDYSHMMEGFDEVEASHGFSDEQLPSGWYPLKVEKVLSTDLSRNGSPQARLQLLVTEGSAEGKRTFANISMGPAKVDRDGAARSDDDLKKTAKTIQGQMRGFLDALGLTTGQPVGDGEEAVYSFFSVGSWAGREFMGYVKLLPAKGQWPASNRLQSYQSLQDEKKGIDAWRAGQASDAAPTSAAQSI